MTTVAGDFDAFLEKTRSQRDESVQWMTKFAEELRELSQKHRDVCRDLERERIAGRHTQDETDRLEQEVKHLKQSLNRGAHVQVLVEADSESYLFDKSYFLDDPFEGGKRAASDLRTRIQDNLEASKPSISELPIAIKAFANSEKLKKLLIESGASGNGSALATFASGFSSADDLTDFVCVGREDEVMTDKISGNLSRSLSSSYCKHIYLGAPIKEKYKETVTNHIGASDSITTINPRSGINSFSLLGYSSISAEVVFKKTTQPAAVVQFPSPPSSPAPTTRASTPATRASTPAQASVEIASSPVDDTKVHNESKEHPEIDIAGSETDTASVAHSRTSSTASAFSTSEDSLLSLDYDGGSEEGDDDGNAIVVHRKATPPGFGNLDADSIILNSDGHRLDSILPPRSEAAAASLNQKTRSGRRRFCKMFHLYDSGSCDAATCAYSHERLTQGEKMVMRHRLRGEKCHDRGRCRDSRCFYGHHCSCLRGTRNCPFPLEMHHIDDETWTILKTGGAH